MGKPCVASVACLDLAERVKLQPRVPATVNWAAFRRPAYSSPKCLSRLIAPTPSMWVALMNNVERGTAPWPLRTPRTCTPSFPHPSGPRTLTAAFSNCQNLANRF